MIALTTMVQQVPSTPAPGFWGRMVENFPTDPASLFTLTLLFALIGLVLWASRPRRPRPPAAGA